MTAAEEERRAQLLAAELAEHDHLVVELDPVEALAVIGMLQLALRHPSSPAGPSQIAGAFIERVVHAYRLRGPDSREFVRVVSEGWPEQQPRRGDVEVIYGDPGGSGVPVAGGSGGRGVVVTEPIAGSIPVELDESLPGDVIEVRGETTTRIRGWSPPAPTRADVVRPAGLVWSGIRVDEMARLYEVLDASHEACPVPLEDGEIVGDPATGRVFVWSRADFDRLAELSRAMHDVRRGRRLPGATYGELNRRARELLASGADAVEIVRALPSGTG